MKPRDLFIRDKLAHVLCLSVVLTIGGMVAGLNLWNDGWSLDLADLFGIPLVIWFLWYKMARNKVSKPVRIKASGGYIVPPSDLPPPPPPVGGSSIRFGNTLSRTYTAGIRLKPSRASVMDNFRIQITAHGDKTLKDAIALAFNADKTQLTTHYAVRESKEGPKHLVFFWTGGGKDAVQMAFKLDAEGAADFARRWLAEAEYGEQPDHDGDNEKGWTVYNEAWGHVDGEWQAIIAVQPTWAMYGK